MNWRLTMNWRSELEAIIDVVPPDQVPAAIGELHRHLALLTLRLSDPNKHGPPVASDGERLLATGEVAQRLNVDARWVQRHKRELGVRRVGRHLRFSESSVERYLKHSRPRP